MHTRLVHIHTTLSRLSLTQMPVAPICYRHVSPAYTGQQAPAASGQGQQPGQWRVALHRRPTATRTHTCGRSQRSRLLAEHQLHLRTSRVSKPGCSGAAAAMAGPVAAGSGMQDSPAPDLEQVLYPPAIFVCITSVLAFDKPSCSPHCFQTNIKSAAAGPVCRGRLRRRSARPECHGELPDALIIHRLAKQGCLPSYAQLQGAVLLCCSDRI